MLKEALTSLQNEFALIEIDGEIRVLKKKEIRNILAGDRKQRLSFVRRTDAKLIMERQLEASNIPIAKPSIVIEGVLQTTINYTLCRYCVLTRTITK